MPTTEFVSKLVERARVHPEAVAVRFHGDRISYRELLEMAHVMRDQIEEIPFRGSTACAPLKKSPQAIGLVVACLLARCQVLLPSPELGQKIIDRLCRRASCSHVLSLRDDGTVTAREVPGGSDRPNAPGARLLLTTSGSTGIPKIVPILEHAADRFFAWATDQFNLGDNANVLSYAPLNFDLSLLDIWATLAAGGCVTLADQDRATDVSYLTHLFEADDITVIQAVPMFYRLLADASGDSRQSFKYARHVIFTGDVMPPSLLFHLGEMFPQARFYNLYGCTETNDSLMREVRLDDLKPNQSIPIGCPLPDVEALILDENDDIITGEGTGELLVSTPFQTSGYLDTSLNAGKFVSHPTKNKDVTLFRTGDIVTRLPNGEFVLQGRADFHVKVRGVRTNMQEVEHVIAQHPNVKEAVVVALPDELAGTRLHAVVQVDKDGGMNGLELRRHCAATLPRTAIPATLEIVNTPLPRTSTGKVDRKIIEGNRRHNHAGAG